MLYLLLILFLLVAFSSFFKYEEKVGNLLFFVCWIACVAIATFRRVGGDCDSLSYLAVFNQSNTDILVEKSFHLIATLVNFCCGQDFLFVLLIYAMIGVSTKFLAIRQLTDLWMLSCVIYISNFFILQDMTQIRVGVASGMLLLCVQPLYEKKWKTFLLFAGIGIYFHYIAFLILPLWFLKTNNFNKYWYGTLIVLAYWFYFTGMTITKIVSYVPIRYIQQKVILNYEATLINNEFAANPFDLFQLLRILVAGILAWKFDRIVVMNKYLPLLLKIYVLGIISFLLFTDILAFSLRISQYLEIVEIILIPLLIYAFKDKRIGIWLPIVIAILFISMNLFQIKLIF